MSETKLLLSLLILSLLYTNSISKNLNSSATICPMFSCGGDGDVTIRYPFWENGQGTAKQYCGYPQFGLACSPEGETILKLPGDGGTYYNYSVKDINYTDYTLTLVHADVVSSDCPRVRHNISLESVPLNYSPSNLFLSFYFNCTKAPSDTLPPIYCWESGSDGRRSYVSVVREESDGYDWAGICEEKVVTAVIEDQISDVNDLTKEFGGAMKKGFVLNWRKEEEEKCGTCEKNGGRCGYNVTTPPPHFVCFCKNGTVSINQCKGKGINWRAKLGIGFGAAGFTCAIMFVGFFIYQRRNRKKYVAPSSYVSRNISSDLSSMSDLEKMGSYFGVHLFTYEELEEATNNFDSSKELGDGGFGTVYYGKLRDGRVVAVKRLYESNYKRVEQFMNEVEILTRLRHKNLVLLYGCTSRHSRELLLVYEYISNGTVADHLHGERAKPRSLPWPIRLKIAIETASALAYLHASDIIHRDVKTNNILLDDHFCVKVADFGLSRLFPTDVTHISTAPQGTPGYVDPDYHQCYQLTDKSDVYSFGVVLIELISSKPAVDITRHRHEINLSNMAINKIQNRELHELVDPSIGFESDCTIKMMVTAVAALAFQCLQSEKDMRPTMEEVFDSLKDILQYNEKPAEEVNIPADDVEKLKSVQPPLPLSPVSVTANWVISSSSTPNGSG